MFVHSFVSQPITKKNQRKTETTNITVIYVIFFSHITYQEVKTIKGQITWLTYDRRILKLKCQCRKQT